MTILLSRSCLPGEVRYLHTRSLGICLDNGYFCVNDWLRVSEGLSPKVFVYCTAKRPGWKKCHFAAISSIRVDGSACCSSFRALFIRTCLSISIGVVSRCLRKAICNERVLTCAAAAISPTVRGLSALVSINSFACFMYDKPRSGGCPVSADR